MENLFDWENMKKDVAGGMGWIFVAALTSDIRRGRAETASLSSSFIRPSVSSCSSEKFNFWGFAFETFSRAQSVFLLLLLRLWRKWFFSCGELHRQLIVIYSTTMTKDAWVEWSKTKNEVEVCENDTKHTIPPPLKSLTAHWMLEPALDLLVLVREDEERASLRNGLCAILRADLRHSAWTRASGLVLLLAIVHLFLICSPEGCIQMWNDVHVKLIINFVVWKGWIARRY